jgi:hypothetical protein
MDRLQPANTLLTPSSAYHFVAYVKNLFDFWGSFLYIFAPIFQPEARAFGSAAATLESPARPVERGFFTSSGWVFSHSSFVLVRARRYVS